MFVFTAKHVSVDAETHLDSLPAVNNVKQLVASGFPRSKVEDVSHPETMATRFWATVYRHRNLPHVQMYICKSTCVQGIFLQTLIVLGVLGLLCR